MAYKVLGFTIYEMYKSRNERYFVSVDGQSNGECQITYKVDWDSRLAFVAELLGYSSAVGGGGNPLTQNLLLFSNKAIWIVNDVECWGEGPIGDSGSESMELASTYTYAMLRVNFKLIPNQQYNDWICNTTVEEVFIPAGAKMGAYVLPHNLAVYYPVLNYKIERWIPTGAFGDSGTLKNLNAICGTVNPKEINKTPWTYYPRGVLFTAPIGALLFVGFDLTPYMKYTLPGFKITFDIRQRFGSYGGVDWTWNNKIGYDGGYTLIDLDVPPYETGDRIEWGFLELTLFMDDEDFIEHGT